MSLELNPQKARIFRVTHVDNVPWILRNDGLYCQNSELRDPKFVNIGNTDLIQKRRTKPIPIDPGGTLADYIPFYFTPFSIMMYNIHTGFGGITRRANKDLVIFVSSLHRLRRLEVPFVFTDQHAYSIDTRFFSDLEELNQINWSILQQRDFRTDDRDPGKQSRYQAEALVYRHVPLDALLGVGCYNGRVKQELSARLNECGVDLDVKITPGWYFS